MTDTVYTYYVSFVGKFAGDTMFGSDKVRTAAPLDNYDFIQEVAKQIKTRKHWTELHLLGWELIKG